MNEKDAPVLLSNGLPQPPIPRRLLERLRDHPGHLRRLQQELNYTLDGPNRLLNFAPAAPCFQTTNLRYRS